MIWSPGGGAGLWLAISTVGSPPLPGSPSDETTIAASLKSSPAVISLTVTRQVRPAPTAASSPLRESSTTMARSAGTPRVRVASR